MASSDYTGLVGIMKSSLHQKSLNRVLQSSFQQFSNLLEISLTPDLSSTSIGRIVWGSIDHNYEKLCLWTNNNMVGITFGFGRDMEIGNSIQGTVVFATIRSVFDRLQVFVVDDRGNLYQYIVYPHNNVIETLYFNEKVKGLTSKTDKIKYVQPCPIYYEDFYFFWAIYETKIILLSCRATVPFPILLTYSIPSYCTRLLNVQVTIDPLTLSSCEYIFLQKEIETRISHAHFVALHYQGNDKQGHVVLLDNHIALQYADKVLSKEIPESIATALTPPMITVSSIAKNTKGSAIIYSTINTAHYDYCTNHIETSKTAFQQALEKVSVSIEWLVMTDDCSVHRIEYQTIESLIRNYFVLNKDNLKLFFLHYNKPAAFLPKIVSSQLIVHTFSSLYGGAVVTKEEISGKQEQDRVPLWLLCAKYSVAFPTRKGILGELWQDVQLFYDDKIATSSHSRSEEKRATPVFSTPLRPLGNPRLPSTPSTLGSTATATTDPFKSKHEEPWLIRVVLMEAMIGLGLTNDLTNYLSTSYNAMESYQLYELQALFQWIAGEKIVANRSTFVEGVREDAQYSIQSLKLQSELIITKFLEFHLIPTLLGTKTVSLPQTCLDHINQTTSTQTSNENKIDWLTSHTKCTPRLMNNVYYQMMGSLVQSIDQLLQMLQTLKILSHSKLSMTAISSQNSEHQRLIHLEDNIISESLIALCLQAYQASRVAKIISLWQYLYLSPVFHGLVFLPHEMMMTSTYEVEKQLTLIEKTGIGMTFAGNSKLKTVNIQRLEKSKILPSRTIPFLSLLEYPSTTYAARMEESRQCYPLYLSKGLIYNQLIHTSYDHYLATNAVTASNHQQQQQQSILPPLCQTVAKHIFKLPEVLFSSQPINGTTTAASSVAKWVSELFQLPITMIKHSIDEILQGKLYLHHTIQDMVDWLNIRMRTMLRVYLYVILTAYDYHAHQTEDMQRLQQTSHVPPRNHEQLQKEIASKKEQEKVFYESLTNILGISCEELQYINALRSVDQYPNYTIVDTKSTGSVIGEHERTTHTIQSCEMIHPYVDIPSDEKTLQDAVKILTFKGQETHFLDDHALLTTVVSRLIAHHQFDATQAMLLSFGMRQHPVLQTSFGAMAFAVAIPDERRWKDTWQYARLCCEKMNASSIALETLMDITRYYCLWTIKQKQFSHFLDEFLTLPEIEAVIQFLTDKAKKDIQDARSPSPAVDTLVGFLLKHHRMEEAQAIHIAHKHAVSNVIHANRNEDSLAALRERERLLTCYQQHVKHVPSVDVQLVSNLYRGFHHVVK